MQSIDELLTAWRRELPEGDFESLAPMARAVHMARVVDTFERRVIEPFEISLSEYEVLAALRREGPPYRLNPSTLQARLDRSSGGLTKLLKRLEDAGHVERRQDPEDGRGSLVILSRRGLELQGRILAAFAAAAENRLAELGEARLREIDTALARLVEALER